MVSIGLLKRISRPNRWTKLCTARQQPIYPTGHSLAVCMSERKIYLDMEKNNFSITSQLLHAILTCSRSK